jgi:transcriptional regulator with XRE-family HTH domain
MSIEFPRKNIVGKNIGKYRMALGLSVGQLAAKAGMDRTNIHRIEQTGKNYSHDSLTSIAKALNIRIGELFDESDTLQWSRMVPLDIYTPEMIHRSADGKTTIDRPAHETGGVSNVLFTDGLFAENSFGFKVNDMAMSPQLLPGDMAIVDPTIQPEPNDLVLAAIYRHLTGKTQAIIRRFAERAGGFELLPMDIAYAVESPVDDNIGLIGTVVEQRRQRRR